MDNKNNRRELQEYFILDNAWICCLNCENWGEGIKQCEKYNAVPPPDVLICGCPEWVPKIGF